MLNSVTSLTQYDYLVNEHMPVEHSRRYTNLFAPSDTIKQFIASNRLFYQIVAGTLCFFFDMGLFYKLYFMSLPDEKFHLTKPDKNICCEIIQAGDLDGDKYSQVKKVLQQNGFVFNAKLLQYRLQFGAFHTTAAAEMDTMKKRLHSMELTVGYATKAELPTVKKIFLEYLGMYDMALLEDIWLKQLLSKNILCLRHNKQIVAVYCFHPKSDFIVVTLPYRAMGLGHLLRMYFIGDVRWNGSTENYYSWAREDNLISIKCFLKLGGIVTGKSNNRYLLEYNK